MSQSTAQNAEAAKPAPPRRPPRPPVPPVPPEYQADAIMKMQSPELVAMLKNPSSSRFQKSKACMRLAVIGTKEAVPVLAPMLSDPEMAHYARFALVPMPDPAAAAALRDALPRLNGMLLVSVIDAIGQRQDPGSVAVLTPFVTGSDNGAAKAAIGSLGQIGTTASAKVLEQSLATTKDPLRKDVAAACLVCAERLFAKGQRGEALALFTRLSQPDVPQPERIGAMNAIIFAETSPNRPK